MGRVPRLFECTAKRRNRIGFAPRVPRNECRDLARRKTTQLPEINNDQEGTEHKSPIMEAVRSREWAHEHCPKTHAVKARDAVNQFSVLFCSVTTPGFSPEIPPCLPIRAFHVKQFVSFSENPLDSLLRLLNAQAFAECLPLTGRARRYCSSLARVALSIVRRREATASGRVAARPFRRRQTQGGCQVLVGIEFQAAGGRRPRSHLARLVQHVPQPR